MRVEVGLAVTHAHPCWLAWSTRNQQQNGTSACVQLLSVSPGIQSLAKQQQGNGKVAGGKMKGEAEAP